MISASISPTLRVVDCAVGRHKLLQSGLEEVTANAFAGLRSQHQAAPELEAPCASRTEAFGHLQKMPLTCG